MTETEKYFTISEAAKQAKVKPHVIRYWEQKIPQLAAAKKSRKGRRYYSREEVALLQRMGALLAKGGYTIDGAGAQLVGSPRKRAPDNMAQLRRDIERVIAVL